MTRTQGLFQFGQKRGLRPSGVLSETEGAAQKLHEFRTRERRVVQIDASRLRLEHQRQCGMNERRLSSPGLPDEERNPALCSDSVLKGTHHLAVLGGEIQVLRVGRQLEGRLTKAKKRTVHEGSTPLTSPSFPSDDSHPSTRVGPFVHVRSV